MRRVWQPAETITAWGCREASTAGRHSYCGNRPETGGCAPTSNRAPPETESVCMPCPSGVCWSHEGVPSLKVPSCGSAIHADCFVRLSLYTACTALTTSGCPTGGTGGTSVVASCTVVAAVSAYRGGERWGVYCPVRD